MKPELVQLYTERGAALAGEPGRQPWQVYPRPRMKRGEWINLNGEWDFSADDGRPAVPAYDQRIRVPFPPESALSGLRDFQHRKTPFLHYRRRFTLDKLPAGKRLLLHCGGADQEFGPLSFNGAIFHPGHSTLLEGPLTVELPAPRLGENCLELELWDFGGTGLPWGKQRKKRGGMWYTPVSGIWQTLWLEWVPETYIADVRCTPSLEEVRVEVLLAGSGAARALQSGEGCILFAGKKWPLAKGKAVLKPDVPRLWSPEDPYLYEFTVLWGEDRVESYFALRTVGVGAVEGIPRLLLNGKPCFFRGLLDQGYWPEGLWTPPDPACYEDDILAARELGFNMLRKHVKIEPELFYYACDRLGMTVFQDMINCGPYSFLRDTVLPTLGLRRLPQLFRFRSRSRWERFRQHMEAAVRLLRSHPSVVCWTIYNEGWGQQYTDRAWESLKALDPDRIVDSASGWFRVGRSDVDSRHVYFRPFRMPKPRGRPVVLSEFGGYVWKDPAHSFNLSKTYGYKVFRSREAWAAALERLWTEQILPNVEKGLCAAVYTQLSDVEDETNGLLCYDRRRKLEGAGNNPSV